jgi:hypothetical protein
MVDHTLGTQAVREPTTTSGASPLRRRRTWKWIAGLVSAALLVVWAALGVVMLRPPERDYATTRLSEQGLFRVSYTSDSTPIPINQLHRWTLHLETAEGQLVEQADIQVDGDMPEHGHGLPSQPRVTAYLGNGDYLVEGMKFQMTGWWVVDFAVSVDGERDQVRFNLLLK